MLLTISDIRAAAINEEIDYIFLKHLLRDYVSPRDKITSLLKTGALIRVKKGLYVFGEKFARKPFVIETLANLIYGPSYISLDYALAFYGMIPERVEMVTSITNKRDKSFKTPVGIFTYRYIHPRKYPIGISEVLLDETHPVLIATPEKALADKILLDSCIHLLNPTDVAHYLLEDLRIPAEKIKDLDNNRLKKIAEVYANKNIEQLLIFLKKRNK